MNKKELRRKMDEEAIKSLVKRGLDQVDANILTVILVDTELALVNPIYVPEELVVLLVATVPKA